jgi:hypothetical protein
LAEIYVAFLTLFKGDFLKTRNSSSSSSCPSLYGNMEMAPWIRDQPTAAPSQHGENIAIPEGFKSALSVVEVRERLWSQDHSYQLFKYVYWI